MAAASRSKASPSLRRRRSWCRPIPPRPRFPLVAALIVPGSELILEGVMINPLRTGLLTTLREMGARFEMLADAQRRRRGCRRSAGEESALEGVEVPPERAPSMIDEYPILAVAAAFAQGTTRMRGLKELRVKESDRLAATAAMLRVNGVEVEIEGDDLIVHGKGRAPGGGMVATHMDHRHRHVGAGHGLGSDQPVGVDDAAFIATSFPGFAELMRAPGRRPFMIIAIDGPAASGKGTLAKRLAAHFGLRHLDTGLLYRAVALALLDAGHQPTTRHGRRRRARPSIPPSSMRTR